MKKKLRVLAEILHADHLARAIIRRLRRVKRSIMPPMPLWALRIIARSDWASTLYYAFGSRAFRREHQGVLAGRVRYHDEQRSGLSAVYLMRRNIHRIEKGLIMRPLRSVFAADYIEETTSTYCHLAHLGGDGVVSDEVTWAGDVLGTYFSHVGSHPAIDAARAQFEAAGIVREAWMQTPYRRDLKNPVPVAFEDLQALARRRRSVRWFDQRPVPRELIDRALEVAVQAPSACNRQPYRFRIFDDPERAHRVAGIAPGTVGFSDNFPAVAVLIGELSAYFDERDRHVIYIDASLAAMSFLLALETLGLSSCCINWPDIAATEAKMRKELSLRPDERVIMLIAIGYPDPEGSVPYSQKRHLDLVRTYNE